MKFLILPIPFSSDDSKNIDSDQSGFYFEYGMHKWNVKFKESIKNFISMNIEYQDTNKKDNSLDISIPYKILIKFENEFQHQIINHLNFDEFNEEIPFFHESKQKIQVEAYLLPFLPVKCPKHYENIYYSAYCCYFLLNYCKTDKPILEIKNKEENNDKYLIDKQEFFQTNNILQSLATKPISIDQFTFFLNNYSSNEENPILSAYDFSLLDYLPPTIQEVISNIIFNYFSRIFSAKFDCFDKIEENFKNLSYLSKISHDSIALVFLNPSTYKFDENYQITNNANKTNYILYSMVTYEGRNFCFYYHSFNLNNGFKFCDGDCIEFQIDKWPHESSIITIFVRSDIVESFKRQNHFAVYRNYLDQIITVYQFDYRDIDDEKDHISKLIDELQGKKQTNWFFGHFESTRFSILSKQNALVFNYNPVENIFPSFPSIDFDNSCLLITSPPNELRKFVYQLVWFEKVNEKFSKDYFLDPINEIKNRIYSTETTFLPSVQLIKESRDIQQLYKSKQNINKSANQMMYWQLIAINNHSIQCIPHEKEDFCIDLLNFSLVFCVCDSPKGMIPIAIRFGRYSKQDKEEENIEFVFDDDNENSVKDANDAFYGIDDYDDNRKLIFYGVPKLFYKKESDFPLFIQLIQSSFENFIVLYRYIDKKKNPKRPFRWKQISDPAKDFKILQNDIENLPTKYQIYHLMLIEKNDYDTQMK